ncbi:MAG: HlyC/CorC family transporter [Bacteroidales bacterium]|nr:HlyC/CorC family transporter [Bacteroidales bacterium]
MNNWQIIVSTLLLSAFFSGMEIAFITANKLKIELDKSKGLISARILSAFNKKPSRFIGAILLGNNIALVIYGIAMAQMLEPVISATLPKGFHNEFIIILTQTIISTFLILFVAEFIPKVLFQIRPNAIIGFFAVPVYLFYYLFYPIIYLFIGLSEFLLKKIFRVPLSNYSFSFNLVDLEYYLKEFSVETDEKVDLQQEIQMFQNVIEFRDVKLRECMIPRTEIAAVEINDSIEKVKQKFIDTGFSRVPIYEDTIDNIIGYAHAFDLFRNPKEIKSISKPLTFLPETMLANNVLNSFIQDGASLAVVVDEFGGTSGMVTIEDIIEEIVGEIEDEYDVEELVEKQIEKNNYLFSGRIELDYLNEKYELDIPESEEYETLAGFIIYHHKSIPQTKEEVIIGPYHFSILQAEPTRIKSVKLHIKQDKSND